MRRSPALLVAVSWLLIVAASTSPDDSIPPELAPNEIDAKCNAQVPMNRTGAAMSLADHIIAVMEHYQQPDPLGVPSLPIPDPFDVPDTKQNVGVGTMHMRDMKAYGISRFRLRSIRADLHTMYATVSIGLDELIVRGNYTLKAIFQSADGPFQVVLRQVLANGNATLGVERDGRVRMQDLQLDLAFADMSMDFQNLGFMGSLFQSVVNSSPNGMFDSIKPFLMRDAHDKIRAQVDAHVGQAVDANPLPNSISPLDMAISDLRRRVRNMGFDPFRLDKYHKSAGIFAVELSNSWVSGLASFHREGELAIGMHNSTLIAELALGTRRLEGSTTWQAQLASGMLTRIGHVRFTVEHLKARAALALPLGRCKHPQINDLQLELGNIQVRCDGAGTLDYATELVVNVLPNLLRYQIMDAIEAPIRRAVQEKFNAFDVEAAIRQHVPQLQQYGLKQFGQNQNGLF